MEDVSVGNLGSLAESARGKQIKSVRGLLFVIGTFALLVYGGLGLAAHSIADAMIEKEVVELRAQGLEVDDEAIEEYRISSVRAIQITSGIFALLGLIYIVFGILVQRAPVPITIASLVLYIGSNAIIGYLDPDQLRHRWWLKMIIVVALFKAVQAAIASEQEKKGAAGLDSVRAGA